MKKALKMLLLLALVLPVVACGKESGLTHDEAFAKFEEAGLAVYEPRKMEQDDFGFAPYIDDGYIFGVKESDNISEDSELFTEEEREKMKYHNGRLFISSDTGQLDKLESYYVALGKESAMLKSHVYRDGNILLQMTNELSEDEFNAYVECLK